MADFVLRKVYNFSVYPVNLLGDIFQNVTVMGILDEETARAFIDTVGRHKQFYPQLPEGTPNDWTAYNYLKLKLENGDTTVIGIPWIRQDTVVEVTAQQIKAVIPNVTVADIPKIRNALLSNGYTAEVTLVTT